MERHVLLMYTSCGWFFSDLAGLETLQVMKYAARALQLGQQFSQEDLETPFLSILEEAKSNRKEMGSGRDLYLNKIRPSVITFPKVGKSLQYLPAQRSPATTGFFHLPLPP